MDTDVVIVGLSIAGAATALHLARAGHSVTLLERAAAAPQDTTGALLHALGTLELHQLGLTDPGSQLDAQLLETLCLIDADGVEVCAPLPRKAPTYGLKLKRLKRWLAERCDEQPNIAFRSGIDVTAVGVSQSQVIVETSQGDLWARAIVGADGAGSKVREELGLPVMSQAKPRFTLQATFALPVGAALPSTLDLAGGADCVLRLVPTGHRQADVVMWLADATDEVMGEDLASAFFPRLESFPSVAQHLEGARLHSGPTLERHTMSEPKHISQRRAMLVGRAAVSRPTLTGLALSAALIGSRLAASTLSAALAADDLSAARLEPYARATQAKLRDALRVSAALDEAMGDRAERARLLKLLHHHPDTYARLLQPFAGSRLSDVLGAADYWRLFNR